MTTKVCTKCGVEKDLELFHKDKRIKSGVSSICIDCQKIRDKKYYDENIDIIKERRKLSRELNKETRRLNDNKKYKENPDHFKEKSRKYRESHPEKIKEIVKKYYENNKEIINEKNKNYCKEYYKNEINKDKRNNTRRLYSKERLKNDLLFKLKQNIRSEIYRSLKRNGFTKKSRTHEILGCSFEEFKLHLEQQFEPWMNWENYGKWNGELNYGWDIDHIVPTSSGITEDDIIKLNHYKNLKPLCSEVNRHIKSNKVDF